jgi:hypothetical protein
MEHHELITRARNYSREMPTQLVDMIEEIHRNAAAFGWEIGNGAEWSGGVIQMSEDNPFADVNWAAHVVLAEEREEAS